MTNQLSPGDTRIGWMFDGDSETPLRAVGLRNTGNDIEVEVPLDGSFGADDPYARWFQPGIRHSDDPDRTKHTYNPPPVLQFSDADGLIALVGCRFKTANIGTYGGRGVIRVAGAALGARSLDYSKVNGLRTVLPDLGPWSGITSTSQHVEVDDEHRARSLRLDLTNTDPLRLSRRLNLSLRPSWRTVSGDVTGHLVTVDEIHVETRLQRLEPLDHHFELHQAIRELLVVAAGRRSGFSAVSVHRTDDPERTLDGTDRGERWSEFITHLLPIHSSSKRAPQFIFGLDDIGTVGIRRWLALRERFARGLRPLITVLDGSAASIESELFTLGVAIEAIGYEARARRRTKFPVAIDHILDEIGWTPLRDPGSWKVDMIASYSGVKHADDPPPEPEALVRASRGAQVVLRSWVAAQLRVAGDIVLQALRLTSDHRLIPDPVDQTRQVR